MGTLSNMITAQFSSPSEQPAAALAHWRATPPAWLPGDYREIDDSYNSVTWEWRHTQWIMKLVTLNGLLGGTTCYRITALFESDGGFGSRITVDGNPDDKTQAAIESAATSYQVGGTI
jgi:hypothetical protein